MTEERNCDVGTQWEKMKKKGYRITEERNCDTG
jgi:hypothetical protein